MRDPADITGLLQLWREGDKDAENELFTVVMPKLRSLATYLMKGERQGHTLQATELIDQVYFRMVGAKDRDWQNRQHFFAIAARVMRRYLIDHARGRPAGEFLALEGMKDFLRAESGKVELALTVDRLLERMAQIQPTWCTVVEVKFFLGLTDEESAEALGIELRSLQRRWREARQWLFEHMDSPEDAHPSTG